MIHLSLVLTATGVFVCGILLVQFMQIVWEYASAYSLFKAKEMFVNCILLSMIGMLWLTYRRWRNAVLKQEELEDVVGSISPDTMLVVNGEGIITMCNPSVMRMLGFRPDDMIGRRFDSILQDEPHRPSPYQNIHEHLERDGFHMGGAVGITKEGKSVPLEIISGYLKRHDGMVVLLRDVSDRKLLQEQLIQSEKMSALGQMISGVVHELNNPLTGVIGFSQLLYSYRGLSDDAERTIERLRTEADRARGIVQNLLTFSRKTEARRSIFHINSVIESVLELRGYELRLNNIDVIRNFASDLPDITADESQIQQVFLNIILNAEQSILGAEDTGSIEVTTTYDPLRELVVITFEDSGPGIPDDILPRIFDPFFTTKPSGEGTGLGLSLSSSIVQDHSGMMRAENRQGRGARFVVELPAGNRNGTDGSGFKRLTVQEEALAKN